MIPNTMLGRAPVCFILRLLDVVDESRAMSAGELGVYCCAKR